MELDDNIKETHAKMRREEKSAQKAEESRF